MDLFRIGSTGLLTVAWFLHKHTKSHEENENTFRDYLGKAVTLLKEQYEKHAHDHNTQPWLAIDYIRDKLIPEKDQCVVPSNRLSRRSTDGV